MTDSDSLLLQSYYTYIFPSHFIWKRLSLGESKTSPIRIDGEDRSFANAHEFTQYITKNKSKGIYLNSEEMTSTYLIYSVSLWHYAIEDKCSCVEGCSKCWILLVAAMAIIRHKLESTFGLDDITFFYDGNQAVYCLVKTTPLVNQEIVDSCFKLINNQELNKGYRHLMDDRTKNHHYLLKENMPDTLFYEWQLLEILFKEYCTLRNRYLGKQGYLDLIDNCIWNKFENSRLKSMYVHTPIKDRPLEDEPAWSLFKRNVKDLIRTSGPRATHALKTCCYALVFYFMYPRVLVCDRSIRQFLLAPFPFSVNKDTGKLVVPIVPSMDKFNIEQVPTLSDMMKAKDWKTSAIRDSILQL